LACSEFSVVRLQQQAWSAGKLITEIIGRAFPE
jgi:hypothetical protein